MRYFALVITGVSMLTLLVAGSAARADVFSEQGFGDNLKQIAEESAYTAIDNPGQTLPIYIAALVGWTGLLGINIFIQVIMAAYEYMTAHDNAEKVMMAKKRIRNVIYSAIILVAGYLLVAAMVAVLGDVTGYKI